MTEQEINQKIEQCKTNIETLRKNLELLEIQKTEIQNKFIINCHSQSNNIENDSGYQVKLRKDCNGDFWIKTMSNGKGINVCVPKQKFQEIRDRISDLLGE